jgi:FkbM family methyltransferase
VRARSQLRSIVDRMWRQLSAADDVAPVVSATSALSSYEIRNAYELLLQRAPNDDEVAFAGANLKDRSQLLGKVFQSEEFLLRNIGRLSDLIPVTAADLELFQPFGRYRGRPTPGFITDFLGVKTDVAFVKGIEVLGGTVQGYPLPRGNFHGDLTEWTGTLQSVLAAKERFVAVELGAGWAPWLVICARACAIRGIDDVSLIGLEGSSGHAAMMRRHFQTNGIRPEKHQLLHAAVGAIDGVAEFPIASDPAADWGQAAIVGQHGGYDYRGHSITATESVPLLSIKTILADEALVDLVHIDVQGAEVDILRPALSILNAKVKCLIIGTHSRAIEGELVELLGAGGWKLWRDHSCHLTQFDERIICTVDGCQVWHNRGLLR